MSTFMKKITKLSQIQETKALAGERIQEIDPTLIDCLPQIRSKDNPGMTQESLLELGENIKRDGQAEPVILREHPDAPGRFIMVAGERRLKACQLKGLLVKAVVREMTEQQAKRIQRSENVLRENLTQLEIAIALREDKERLGTLEKVAEEWNKGISWVAERIKFLSVIESEGQASEAVTSGITADISAVNDLARLEKIDPEAAKNLVDQVKDDPEVNVRKAVREKLGELKKPAKQEQEPKQKNVVDENQTEIPGLEPRKPNAMCKNAASTFFDKAMYHHTKMEECLNPINSALESLLQETAFLFHQTDGWCIVFDDDSNAPITVTELSDLLSMSKDDALSFLRSRTI